VAWDPLVASSFAGEPFEGPEDPAPTIEIPASLLSLFIPVVLLSLFEAPDVGVLVMDTDFGNLSCDGAGP
jgi:hypothetical protein